MATKKKAAPEEEATPEQRARMKHLLKTRKITAATAYGIVQELKTAETKPMKEKKSGDTESVKFSMSVKDALLFHLWTYMGSPGQPEEMRAQIQETHNILKEGLKDVRIRDIDREKGHYTYDINTVPGWEEEGKAKLLEKHMAAPWARLAIAEMFGFREQLLAANMTQEADRPKHIKTGLHLASQFLGAVDPQTKLNFAEQLERYTLETGLTMNNRPLGFGLDLSPTQQRTLQAILGAFSHEDYQGHITLPKETVLTDPDRSGNYIPAKLKATTPAGLYRTAYRNIPQLPTIQLTLAEVVRLAGMDNERQGDKEKVKEAVAHLGQASYVFWWKRKAFRIENGRAVPQLDQEGKHKWEEVVEAGSLFRVKHVLDEQTKQLKYYEISPSAVVLDQVSPHYGGSYFLMVPGNLHEEVKKALGNNQRSTSYTFGFLMYLLQEYERHRSHNSHRKGVTIQKDWEDIAQRIRMPETIWRRNRKKAVERLEQVYLVAKELGYLKSYKRGADGVDTLELEPTKYYHPEKQLQEVSTQALQEKPADP